jgi:hypothetical protein
MLLDFPAATRRVLPQLVRISKTELRRETSQAFAKRERQYRSVPSGTDSILATMLVLRSFNWIGRAGDPSHDDGAGAVVTLAVVFIVPPGRLSSLDLHHYTDLLQTIDELAQ